MTTQRKLNIVEDYYLFDKSTTKKPNSTKILTVYLPPPAVFNIGEVICLKMSILGTHLKGTRYEANDRWEMYDSEMSIWGTHLKGTQYEANDRLEMYDSEMSIWGTHLKGT